MKVEQQIIRKMLELRAEIITLKQSAVGDRHEALKQSLGWLDEAERCVARAHTIAEKETN